MSDELKDIAKDYAQRYPQITNIDTRKQKGAKIAAVLGNFFGYDIASKTILDVGASGCVPLQEIVHLLKPKKAIGIDLDTNNLPASSGRLVTMVADAMDLPFPDASIDIVICNHVYEHVDDSEKLFNELYRVTRRGGVIYFGAMNARWPMEPHYNILFLHWMPASLAEFFVRKKGFTHGYLEKPLTTTRLKELTKQFELIDYTVPVILNPEKFNATDVISITWIPPKVRNGISRLLYPLLPSYIWILKKPDRED